MLSRQNILGARDLKRVEELVPEWPDETGAPGTVTLSELSAEGAVKMLAEIAKTPEDGMFIVLVCCAIDEDGNQIFTMEDVPALRGKNIRVLNRLQISALTVNGMTVEARAALKKD